MAMRTLAVLSIAVAVSAVQAQKPKTAALTTTATQTSDLLPDEQVQQVLNRLTFGARSGDAAKVRAMGVESWIDTQLHPERIPDARIDSVMTKFTVFSMSTSDVIRDDNVVQQLRRHGKKEAGADPSLANDEGKTPADLAGDGTRDLFA